MKLLAAEKPLPRQVHPTRQQAEEGYRREATAGISLTDPTRNFRDSSHKPEVLYALTPVRDDVRFPAGGGHPRVS